MQVFTGVENTYVELWLTVDNGCGASFTVAPNGGVPLVPQYQNGPTGFRAVFLMALPPNLSSIVYEATPVSPTAATCNLKIEVFQNNQPLPWNPYNNPPGNPWTEPNLAVGAPHVNQFDVMLS